MFYKELKFTTINYTLVYLIKNQNASVLFLLFCFEIDSFRSVNSSKYALKYLLTNFILIVIGPKTNKIARFLN